MTRLTTLLASALAASAPTLPPGACPVELTIPALIIDAARAAGIDPALALHVAWRESRYDSQKISETGDIGVFQLAPVMVRVLGVADPFDARQNIEAGIRRLAECLRQAKGDVRLALCLYAHPGRCA